MSTACPRPAPRIQRRRANFVAGSHVPLDYQFQRQPPASLRSAPARPVSRAGGRVLAYQGQERVVPSAGELRPWSNQKLMSRSHRPRYRPSVERALSVEWRWAAEAFGTPCCRVDLQQSPQLSPRPWAPHHHPSTVERGVRSLAMTNLLRTLPWRKVRSTAHAESPAAASPGLVGVARTARLARPGLWARRRLQTKLRPAHPDRHRCGRVRRPSPHERRSPSVESKASNR